MSSQPVATSSPNILGNVDTLALLAFTVKGDTYSLPITNVVRIIEMVTITPLPNAPTGIRGIINVQGKAVPVMDLRQRFGLPEQGYGLHTPIILTDMSDDGRMLGLIVDKVDDVVHVHHEDLEITELFLPTELVDQMVATTAYLAGVAKIDRLMVPVLDLRALLTPREQIELAQALSENGNVSKDKPVAQSFVS